MLSGNKLVLALWIPVFTGIMLAAIANGYTDLWMFAILIGLLAWTACSRAVLLPDQIKELRHWARATKSDDGEGTTGDAPPPIRDPLGESS
jgi:hypothetical protein